VQRLAALAGPVSWQRAVERGNRYLRLARRLDEPPQAIRFERPAPTPPLAARPDRMSVTDVENWLRDPYTIYAKHILGLPVFEAVDTPPGAADRGTVIHAAIGKFTARFADGLPDDPLATLVAMGREEFASLEEFPEARAFWWPRFLRIARWFVDWELKRRPQIATLLAEKRGTVEFLTGSRLFRLSATADRIERSLDGQLSILDYKTGSVRTERQVRIGLAPQLTLEAAILRRGGFERIDGSGSIEQLAYVSLRGGDPAGECKPIDFKDGSNDSHSDNAFARFVGLVTRFEDETMPYRSLVHPMWRTRYGDYDHLARVKEWAATGGEIEEGAME
jgi:ATP-dependent helicase/nuclease subunit B